MKKLIPVLALTGTVAASCNNFGNNYGNQTSDSSVGQSKMPDEAVADSIVTDTVITNIDIDGTPFFARVFRNKYDEKGKLVTDDDFYFAPIGLTIFRPDTKQTVFLRKFKEENMFSVFKNGQSSLNLPGQVYCSLVTYGGGSGFAATLFRVNKDGDDKVKLIPAFEYGELTSFAISKNDSFILRIAGFWDFDENETHFESHRYRIYKYVFQGDSYRQIELGMTEKKYSYDDEFKQTIEAIKADEPSLLDSFNLPDYVYHESELFGG